MNINCSNPEKWDADIEKSVNHYNAWFLGLAPQLFREKKKKIFPKIRKAMDSFDSKCDFEDDLLVEAPDVLPLLRQMTCPPLAADRLAGLALVPPSAVESMEEGRIRRENSEQYSPMLMEVIRDNLDLELLAWIDQDCPDIDVRKEVAASVIADRICKAETDAFVRNAQEHRQFDVISAWLNERGYKKVDVKSHEELLPGEYAEHVNVMANSGANKVKVSCDVVIQPLSAKAGSMPILMEEKSAGDFANVNKRWKEEATKLRQLKDTYDNVCYVLFLGGYFGRKYLEHEADSGFDWIWEHRVSDMEKLGL